MKDFLIFIICLMSAIFISSCQSKDDYKGDFEMIEEEPSFSSTPAGLKAQEMYNKYGVIFKTEFTYEEFSWDWDNIRTCNATGTTGYRYTAADLNFAGEVMDSVDKWVFQIFPEEFIAGNMPIKILMADTICNRFTYLGKIVARILEGDLADNYTMIGYTSSRFTTAKKTRTLIESWVSLFVEKMVIAERLTVPSQFIELSRTGYAKLSFTNSENVVTNYGILKKGRMKQNTGSATAAWYATTPAQDFGDFVAFIVYVPDEEKETYYAKNAIVKTKANIVKKYFLDNFDIELPYIPKSL